MSINPTDITLAFADGAGLYPNELHTVIRTVLLALTLIWAAWVVVGTLQSIHLPDFTFITLILRLLTILLIVSGCIALIAL